MLLILINQDVVKSHTGNKPSSHDLNLLCAYNFWFVLYFHRVQVSFVFLKLSYYSFCRSPLADIVQPEDVKELCKHLVIVSGEAAMTFAGMFDNNITFYSSF